MLDTSDTQARHAMLGIRGWMRAEHVLKSCPQHIPFHFRALIAGKIDAAHDIGVAPLV